MKLRIHAALLWAMLCLPLLLRGQTPFFLSCKGSGENNLANFNLQNQLPPNVEGCLSTGCNPYFINALKVEGTCVSHQWAFDGITEQELQDFEFCRPFAIGQAHKVKHTLTIENSPTDIRIYTAQCSFNPVVCCEINLAINLVSKEVINETAGNKTCMVTVDEMFNSADGNKYIVETLNSVVYEGKTPQGAYRVPCGKIGDVICFTAKNETSGCEESKCLFLDDVSPGNAVMPKVQANNSEQKLNMTCFPNPASDLLHVDLFLPEGNQGNLQMMNIYGAVVYETAVATGYITKEIETSAFPAGTYLVLARNGNQVATAQKVVLMKK